MNKVDMKMYWRIQINKCTRQSGLDVLYGHNLISKIEKVIILIRNEDFDVSELKGTLHDHFGAYDHQMRSLIYQYILVDLDESTPKHALILKMLKTEETETNPYPSIFFGHGYHLFKYLQNHFVENPNDYGYIYHEIYDSVNPESPIICTPTKFNDFLNKEFQIRSSRIKPKDQLTNLNKWHILKSCIFEYNKIRRN